MAEAKEILERMFRALESRDRDAALATFAPDAVLFDPHYPQPRMQGRSEIAEGLDWGLSVMQRFGFRTVHFFGSNDGKSGALEIDTNHALKSGQNLVFPQMFVVETRDGLVTALRAYEPYGPNGIGGVFLGIERLKRRQKARRRSSRAYMPAKAACNVSTEASAPRTCTTAAATRCALRVASTGASPARRAAR